VTEDEQAWKGFNRPPAADRTAAKAADKSHGAAAGGGGRGGGRAAGSAAAATAEAGKEPDGLSRAELKKLALEERRRREREGKTLGAFVCACLQQGRSAFRV